MVAFIYHAESYNRKEAGIRKAIRDRGITRLCHMTQCDKLLPILSNRTGIRAVDFIDKSLVMRNDMQRLDGKTEYISTSVEYPNIWFYKNKRYVYPGMTDWAVIFIEPQACINEKTLFCPVNAAASYGAYIGEDVECLKELFAEQVGNRIRMPKMLKCCPTDDQAEVMIYRNIPTKYITGIAFENETILKRMHREFVKRKMEHPALFVAPALFDTTTSVLIRTGLRPEEKFNVKESRLWQRDLCS